MNKTDEFKLLVFRTRFYQKRYKETGNKHDLHTLINLEKEVDNALDYLEKERLGASKKPPISDLFQDLK